MIEQGNFCRILEGELKNNIRGFLFWGIVGMSLFCMAGCEKKEVDKRGFETDNPVKLYVDKRIIFDMGNGKMEEVNSSLINEWIIVNGSEITIDKEMVKEWVRDFSEKYDTNGSGRKFTTHDGKSIIIEGGDYAWEIDCDRIEKAIEDFICYEDGENTKIIKPYYISNYSEIDLSEQMVYVFKEKKQVYKCKCVTGLDSDDERRTKTGCYYVKEKKKEYILNGDDYSIPTKYWIRITWSGTGYHYMNRSDWDEWSPSLYKTKGSHGCINLRLEDAKKVYELVSFHDAVFIHE